MRSLALPVRARPPVAAVDLDPGRRPSEVSGSAARAAPSSGAQLWSILTNPTEARIEQRPKGPDDDKKGNTAKKKPPKEDKAPDKSSKPDKADAAAVKECKGSAIRVDVLKNKAFPDSFDASPTNAMLDGSSCNIAAPLKTTEISQHEDLAGTLSWSCPKSGNRSGKKGTEKATHVIDWSATGGKLRQEAKSVDTYDAHTYGLCCMPGSAARKDAEKKGFDMKTCNWTFTESYTADTKAQDGGKLLHRCKWGFNWDQSVAGGTATGTKSAKVSYWGVDSEKVV